MNKLLKEYTYTKLIRVFLFIMFAMLFVVGVAYTGINLTIYNEMPILCPNNPMAIFLSIVVIWIIFLLLSKAYDKCIYKVKPWIITVITCVIVYGLSVYWITCAQALPQADSKSVVDVAMQICYDTQTPFVEDSYMSFFPYQMGFVTFVRVLVKLFGQGEYMKYCMVQALDTVMIVASGCGIIKNVSNEEKSGKIRFFYCFMMLFCLPLYFYAALIYGDVPYAALSLFAIFLLLECIKKPSVIKYILFFLTCGANYMVRSYALITVAAMAVFLIIRAFDLKKLKSSAILLLLMLSGTFLITNLNYKLYSNYNVGKYDSVPFICSVTMGMNDDNGNAGWCNFYEQITFTEAGFDAELASDMAKEDLKVVLTDYFTHPLKGLDFFYRKINLQWNTPMYQSLCMICSHDAENQPKLGVLLYESFDAWWKLTMFTKKYQIFLYGSIFAALFMWIRQKKQQSLALYLPMIVVFGNFLFSIIWEAKTRYVFPAFLMLIPFAAICVESLIEWAREAKNERFMELITRKDTEKAEKAETPESLKKTEKYPGLDLIKFIMAAAVVAIHVIPHIKITEQIYKYQIVEGLIRPAVGFFFLAAGFLLAKKLLKAPTYEEKKKIIIAYALRLIKLYLVWSIIYLPLAITDYMRNKFALGYCIKSYIQGLIFTGEHYNSWILWYLLSSIYACFFVLLLLKINVKERTLLVISGFMFLLNYFINYVVAGNLAGPFYDGMRIVVDATIQNGRILGGLCFIPLGMYLCQKKLKTIWGVILLLGGYAFSFALVGDGIEMAAMSKFGEVPFLLESIGLLIIGVNIKLPDIKLWAVLRKSSTLIYFLHMWVYTIIYMLLYRKKIYGFTMYIYVLAATVIVSIAYVLISERIKAKGKEKAVKQTE